MIIEMIQKENDIKKLDHTQLKELQKRSGDFFLIRSVVQEDIWLQIWVL